MGRACSPNKVTVKWGTPRFLPRGSFYLCVKYSRLSETYTQIGGRLFLAAKALFSFGLRVELRIGSYAKGLTGKARLGAIATPTASTNEAQRVVTVSKAVFLMT